MRNQLPMTVGALTPRVHGDDCQGQRIRPVSDATACLLRRIVKSRRFERVLLAMMVGLLAGCAKVSVGRFTLPSEQTPLRRDILSSRHLSAQTSETLAMKGLDDASCEHQPQPCIEALSMATPLEEGRRQSAMAELWLARAQGQASTHKRDKAGERTLAYLEAARRAYAYLFFTQPARVDQASGDRQAQVRDFYNDAVQNLALAFAPRRPGSAPADLTRQLGQTQLDVDIHAMSWPGARLRDVSAASTMRFHGLRHIYRREGFGAALALALEPAAAGGDASYQRMPTPSATVFLRFSGGSLPEVTHARHAVLEAHDPFRDTTVAVATTSVPLAGDFTAGYGLWLSGSGFAKQSLATLFGRSQGIDQPRIYLLQPFDPRRRVVLFLHGLASSPEAWANMANDIMGDERLRENYQLWEVYYPTNMPLAYNNRAIRDALDHTLRQLDPSGRAAASHHMVLIGHSMGGVLARLMVSSSGPILWDAAMHGDAQRRALLERHAGDVVPYLRFDALPNIDEVVFLATPHRGTVVGGHRLARLFANLVRLPAAAVSRFAGLMKDLGEAGGSPNATGPLLPNSIDNLRADDPFLQAAAKIPMQAGVRYHSIIARRHGRGPLQASDDGLVPYWSAHIQGAASEKIIVSGHSVQETPEAISEVRHILTESLNPDEAAPL